MSTRLKVNNIRKNFGENIVLHDLSFSLEKGEIGCLLGPSGCGKTTALRIIAGFECVSGGEVFLADESVTSIDRLIPPQNRKIGMVFQDYALFPHMTVEANIMFAVRSLSAKEKASRLDEMLNMFKLNDARRSYPHELSGGQQQRVSMARALIGRPQIVLMDEPFSNLDVALRDALSREVRAVLKRYETTALVVTHNQQEAFALGDKIGVMQNGVMHQWDTAYEIYHNPASKFVANFVGAGSFIEGVMQENCIVRTAVGDLSCHKNCQNSIAGAEVRVLLRPEDLVYDKNSSRTAEVTERFFQGPNILYTLKLDSNELVQTLLSSHINFSVGERIPISDSVKDLVFFEK